jgi:hypothetical protein
MEIDIDPNNIKIELTGSFITKIASLFEELLKKVIIKEVKEKALT